MWCNKNGSAQNQYGYSFYRLSSHLPVVVALLTDLEPRAFALTVNSFGPTFESLARCCRPAYWFGTRVSCTHRWLVWTDFRITARCCRPADWFGARSFLRSPLTHRVLLSPVRYVDPPDLARTSGVFCYYRVRKRNMAYCGYIRSDCFIPASQKCSAKLLSQT